MEEVLHWSQGDGIIDCKCSKDVAYLGTFWNADYANTIKYFETLLIIINSTHYTYFI